MKIYSRLYGWAREVQLKEGSFSLTVFNASVKAETNKRILNMLNRFESPTDAYAAIVEAFKGMESVE